MKKIIASGISTVTYCALIAQPSANSNSFSMQLNELINTAKKGFKTMPIGLKLQGSLASSIKLGDDSTSFYHFLFANKIPIKEADSLIKKLTEKIKSSLGNEYIYQQGPQSPHHQENCFINKNNLSLEVITLTRYYIAPTYNIYIDIFYGKKKRMKYANFVSETTIHDSSNIASRVIKIIIDKLGVEEAEVTAKASFTNDLGADSLDTVELLMEFEKEFNISIPDEDCEHMITVGQAITYMEDHVKNN